MYQIVIIFLYKNSEKKTVIQTKRILYEIGVGDCTNFVIFFSEDDNNYIIYFIINHRGGGGSLKKICVKN